MTKLDAREQIRNHLDKRGNHSVDITERMVRYWWRVVNVALFENKLYPPNRILIKPLKDWGFCQASSNRRVSIGFDKLIPTRTVFLSTVVHEMVHQWEYQTHGRMGHGKRYKQWVDRCNNYLGLDIDVAVTEEDYTMVKNYTRGEINNNRC